MNLHFLILALSCGAARSSRLLRRLSESVPAGDSAYDIYTSSWIDTHENWFSVTHEPIQCDGSLHFPACVDGRSLEGGSLSCPSYACSGACTPTPGDTIDFVAPPPGTSLDTTDSFCDIPEDHLDPLPPYYGFDTGVPPLFVDLQYAPLLLSGTVRAQQGTTCDRVSGATVEIWHVNPTGFNQSSFAGARPDDERSQHDTSQRLRAQSCRGLKTTGDDGDYSFETVVPPSYGPPRHINVMVKAPGFQTLITRVYFSDDFRLRQLTILHGEENTMFVDGLSGRDYLHGFTKNTKLNDEVGNEDGDERYQNIFPGNIGRDPRVLDVFLGDATTENSESSVRLTATFDIILRPLRPIDSLTPDTADTSKAATDEWEAAGLPDTPTPPLDLTGMWSDELGGLISVETFGNLFLAAEYPHPRRWGTVFGAISGDTVRGVDFRGLSHADTILSDLLQRYVQLSVDGEIRPVLSELNTQLLWQDGDETITRTKDAAIDSDPVGIDVAEATETSNRLRDEALGSIGAGGRGIGDDLTNINMWSATLSTGVVSRLDAFNTDVDEARIEWFGGVSEEYTKQYWSKYTKPKTYRYLKVLITRETGGYEGGRMEINEIQFFEGILAQAEYPRVDMKMKSPRTPSPQMVTCSSFMEQPKHCFRAFDGDSSSKSAWTTVPVGSDRKSLTPEQWVTLDFGEGLGIRPTSIRIVCGASDPTNARGCPMTFELLGSEDNIRFSKLISVDMYDYTDEFNTADGLSFDLFWESPKGRENGHKCGTCDSGPDFVCSTGAFDSTCASRYCGVGGFCEKLPACPMGWYLASSVAVSDAFKPNARIQAAAPTDRGTLSCAPCKPGTYGDRPGLVHNNCSGLCEEGYYCTGAATNPRQHSCGSASVYCPEGTGPEPILIGAGEKCLGSAKTPQFSAEEEHCAETTLCSLGHYCINGVERKCPVGRFGSSIGLMSSDCTGLCVPGEFCPEGSVAPTICPKGYYCSQGHIRSPCPAGRYGARIGLEDRACSGLCRPGYYCPEGSTSKQEMACPAGRFGAIAGLTDASCSGSCHSGFYCPLASSNEKMLPCGGTGVYCPQGSLVPVGVTPGYYSVGSSVPSDENTMTGQERCERGFYCTRTEYPQPEGVHFEVHGGTRHPCPPGSFGSAEGLVSTTKPRAGEEYNSALLSDYKCSGLCEKGFYCPLNSTSGRQVPCPAGRYGATAGLADDHCTAICPMGHYCPLGSFEPVPCPAGTYGNVSGLTNAACSMQCWAANSDLSNARSTVIALLEQAEINSAADSISGEMIYSPGIVCSEASPNRCHEGFYCPAGSLSGDQLECGHPGVYCPLGSSVPTPVRDGYYSMPEYTGLIGTGRRQVSERICPLGHYCTNGIKIACRAGTFGASEGLSTGACSGLCPSGHFCPEKSSNGTTHRCPSGRYGATEGLENSACTGICAAGYFCPEGSTSRFERQCGFHFSSSLISENSTDSNSVFCPDGSSEPLLVQVGYYSIGFNRTIRDSTTPCHPGSYCSNGIVNDCPAGRFGAVERLSDARCSGPCKKGHYCPPGSTSEVQFPCPIGRYGDKEGLTDAFCSGGCTFPEICPLGSEINYISPDSVRGRMV